VSALMMLAGPALAEVIGWRPALVLTFAAAACAPLLPGRRRRLRQCALTIPLAPRGWPADRDCLRFGLLSARRCVATCWPLMLAVVVDHSLVVMVGATAVVLAERRARQDSPHGAALAAVAVASLGVVALLLTLAGPAGTP
jgi:predicted metal-binding membrane protein